MNKQQFSAVLTKLFQDAESRSASTQTEHVIETVDNTEAKKACFINHLYGHSSANRHNINKK